MGWCRIKSSLLIQATLLVSAVLNRAAVGASSMSGGKLFQFLTVLGHHTRTLPKVFTKDNIHAYVQHIPRKEDILWPHLDDPLPQINASVDLLNTYRDLDLEE